MAAVSAGAPGADVPTLLQPDSPPAGAPDSRAPRAPRGRWPRLPGPGGETAARSRPRQRQNTHSAPGASAEPHRPRSRRTVPDLRARARRRDAAQRLLAVPEERHGPLLRALSAPSGPRVPRPRAGRPAARSGARRL